jgi:hypothetical protein
MDLVGMDDPAEMARMAAELDAKYDDAPKKKRVS